MYDFRGINLLLSALFHLEIVHQHSRGSMTRLIPLILILISSTNIYAQNTNAEEPNIQAIDWAWAGQRVWFDFVSQGNYQMIAYYDASRQMSVAVREMGDINGGPWQYHKLPSFLGWDAHNKVEAAFDKNGTIHVVGNMHANALVYFRSTEPYDPRTLKQVSVMVNHQDEQQMTYPEFFKAPDGNLIFKYRDGTSGQGKWFYNSWNAKQGNWTHLHESVLLDGEDIRSVYPVGPVIGPDGVAHIVFVWRETPKASSNHDLSYARSRDLVNWETSSGEKIELPITLNKGEIIDPITEHGGLLNGRTPIGFDAQGQALVTYQKYDSNGQTQVYLLRRENNQWHKKQVSNWKNSRVELDKSGALDLPIITKEPAFVNKQNNIVVSANWRDVRWEWVLDNKNLELISGGPIDDSLPESIAKYDLDNNIPLRVLPLMEEQAKPSQEYFLSWEALQPNRDQARADIPAPTTLRVHKVLKSSTNKK